MSKFYADLRALENSEHRLRRLTRELEGINESFKAIRNSLDSDIRYSRGIDGQFSELSAQLSEEEHMLFNSANLLKKAVEDYKASEKTLNGSLQKIHTDPKLRKTFDVFGDAPPICPAPSNGNVETEVTSEDGGMMDEVLKGLPGGAKPTEAEIAQMDAILDKYELMLIEHYKGASTYDIKEILDAMAKELAPIANKHRYDFTWFYYAVNTGCILDVKNSRVVNIDGEDVKIWNQPWMYGKNEYAGDFTGNFLYGYLGAEIFGTGELGQSVLKGSAGLAQFLSDRGNTNVSDPLNKYFDSLITGRWGDNKGDSDQIQLGINSYIGDHGRWGKVIDFADIINPLDDLLFAGIPNIFDPDGILKDGFIEDESGFLRDVDLLNRIIGSEIYYTGSEVIPEVVNYLNDRVFDLITFAGNKINDGIEAVEEGFEAVGDAIGDGLDAAGDLIGDGIEATGDAIGDGLEAVGDGIDAAGEVIGDGVKAVGDGIESVGDTINDWLS